MAPLFDYEVAGRRSLAFATESQRVCGASRNAETGASIQDARFLGQVYLHGWLLPQHPGSDTTIPLRVSN